MKNDWQLNHVGHMVTNRNAILKYLQSLRVGVSVGPQPLLPHEDGEGSLTFYRTLDGDPVTSTYPTGGAHNFRDGESQIGDCQLECYAMKPGPGMFITEYLAQKGPGINHICFNVQDIDTETQKLLDAGCDLVFDARVNGKTVENYLDTRKHGDLMISLRPPATDWELAWKKNNMEHPLVNNWKFLGVGIGVKDVDATVAYYESLGFAEVGSADSDATMKTKVRQVQVGPLVFEFAQPTGNESIYQDSFNVRDEGVNDLIFVVEDLEKETEKLSSSGAEILLQMDSGHANPYTFFDTRAEGNIMMRLVQA
ncbi:MAG: VOC family protein [Pseudomonadota bacterium]